MPADSWPRCWRAYRPKYVSFATSVGSAPDRSPDQTPKTPQASWGPLSWGSRSRVSRPSPPGTAPSLRGLAGGPGRGARGSGGWDAFGCLRCGAVVVRVRAARERAGGWSWLAAVGPCGPSWCGSERLGIRARTFVVAGRRRPRAGHVVVKAKWPHGALGLRLPSRAARPCRDRASRRRAKWPGWPTASRTAGRATSIGPGPRAGGQRWRASRSSATAPPSRAPSPASSAHR